jgi:membrane-associated phospholipid phosphatase
VVTRYKQAKKKLTILKSTATILSVLFHPVILPTYVFACLIFFAPATFSNLSEQGKYYLLLLIFITTCILPIFLMTIFLQLTNRTMNLKAFFMGNRRERIVPYLITAVFYSSLAYFFDAYLHMSGLIIYLVAAIGVTILVLSLITLFYKVSAHATGLSGAVVILVMLSMRFADNDLFYPIITFILISGFVMSSRLFLKAHTGMEIITGVLTGFIVNFCIFYFVLNG